MTRLQVIFLSLLVFGLSACCRYNYNNGICDNCSVTRTMRLKDSFPGVYLDRNVVLLRIDSSYCIITHEKAFFKLLTAFIQKYPHGTEDKELLRFFLEESAIDPYNGSYIVDLYKGKFKARLKLFTTELIEEGECAIENLQTGKGEKTCTLVQALHNGSGTRKILIRDTVLYENFEISCIPTGY